MSMGEYAAISKGYQIDRITRLREHRDLLGAILRENPKKIFKLPGDWKHLEGVKAMTGEEIKNRLIKLGIADKLGLNE
jgi:hypothetical protein